jgi:hypothetical protein
MRSATVAFGFAVIDRPLRFQHCDVSFAPIWKDSFETAYLQRSHADETKLA